MKLIDLFEDLTFGELSQLHLGGAETQGITVDNRPQVVNHINRGLTALHRRFAIRKETTLVTLEAPAGEPQRVAFRDVELPAPFLRLEQIPWPQDIADTVPAPVGTRPVVPIGDEGNPWSVLMPTERTLVIPELYYEHGVESLTVHYRANHAPIDKEEVAFDPEWIEVELPEVFREPLIYFVASRILNPLGFGVEGTHEGNNYYQKYEQACAELETAGWDTTNLSERTGFARQGFV